jgi:hypothetical protein
MIDVKQKTFWEEVSKLLRDWAKGGYNQDWCDFWTKLNHLKKTTQRLLQGLSVQGGVRR